MKKINWKVFGYLLFAVMFAYSQNSVFAQYDQNKGSNRTSGNTNVQDQSRNNQNNDQSNVAGMDTTGREQQFRQIAKEMSTDLMNRVNLSLEQAAEISDILVDYQKDVAEVKDRRWQNDNNNTGLRTSPDRTGTGTTGGATTGTTNTDRGEGTTGTTTTDDATRGTGNDDGTMTGNADANDLMQEFRNIDEEANSQIENALEENQIQKYMSVKKDWWSKVKSRVHQSSPMDNNLNIQNNGMDNQNPDNKTK